MRTSTSIPRIYTDEHGLKHRELTEKIIGIFFVIYNELGHGFVESVYEEAFSVSRAEHDTFFQRQVAVPVWFHGQKIGDFRADLLVDSKVIVELKVGILFNFGPKAEFKRYIFENDKKNPRESALILGREVRNSD